MIAAFMHRKLTILFFLFFSTASAGLLAQVVEDPQGSGAGNPQPPIPWAIRTPNGNLGIAGTSNNIQAAGTWPLNDPGWTHKYIYFKFESFTDPASGKKVPSHSLQIKPDTSGNWDANMSVPNNMVEKQWPNGSKVTISIGQAKLVPVEITNPATGLVTIELRIERGPAKASKTFNIINP